MIIGQKFCVQQSMEWKQGLYVLIKNATDTGLLIDAILHVGTIYYRSHADREFERDASIFECILCETIIRRTNIIFVF